jgi:UDP-sugar transporter A1/2/3
VYVVLYYILPWNLHVFIRILLPCRLIDVAYAHLEANIFAVIVQTKMLFTAVFFVLVLHKKLARKQVYSLVILTVGVMLCSMKPQNTNNSTVSDKTSTNTTKGILATLTIAMSSGFASVYTEKVIKANANVGQSASETGLESSKKDDMESTADEDVETTAFIRNQSVMEILDSVVPIKYSLAYTQVQLALVSLVILGIYVTVLDYSYIQEKGFLHNFNHLAFLSSVNSAVGGLIVAAVLKYADSVLKGYSTAVSVLLTGIASHMIFGTELPILYWMGLINVTISIFLYNAIGLDEPMF